MLELKLVQDIQVFIGFAIFYWHFIQGFRKIAASLILMLKTSFKPTDGLPATNFDNGKVIDSSSRLNKKSAKFDFTKPVHGAEKPSFLISNTRQTFIQLRQVFTKAPIL